LQQCHAADQNKGPEAEDDFHFPEQMEETRMVLAFMRQFQKVFSRKSMHQCEAENGRRRILHDRGKTHHKAPFLYGAAARQAVKTDTACFSRAVRFFRVWRC
jgi:hypothetical protein